MLQKLSILLHKHKALIHLKAIRLIAYSLYQAKLISKKYAIIYLNHYKDEYNIYGFKKQQDLWFV